MTMPPHRSVALVIGDDQNDVRLLRPNLGLRNKSTDNGDEHKEISQSVLHVELINYSPRIANFLPHC